MKTKSFLAILLLSAALIPGVRAQTFAEFFRQNKTQEKYLIQQIAALAVYSTNARTGYGITNLGLKTIRAFTGEEFDLHADYITGLSVPKSLIKVLSGADALKTKRSGLEQIWAETLRHADPDDKAELQKLIRGLREETAQISAAYELACSDRVAMSDEERLKTIEKLRRKLDEVSTFSSRIAGQVRSVKTYRQQETESIHQLHALYE
ncbi:MAG: hypothetical protein INR69_19790 [Mucilaginibacter polytrichastri]|nr:hypothetical protein [Mucilaginibacter polytrichastri]